MIPQINTVSGATNPPPTSHIIEFGHAIKVQSDKIADLEVKILALENSNRSTLHLCDAYRDLHSYRLLSLLVFPIAFLVFIIVYTFAFSNGDKTFDLILKITGISSAIGLGVQVYLLPNKLKNLEDKIKDHKDEISDIKKKIANQSNSVIPSPEVSQQINPKPSKKGNAQRAKRS